MSRIWNCKDDVNNAVRALRTIHSRNGTVPADLVLAYREILSTASKGLVALFYQRLADQCPEALALFEDVRK